MDKTEASVKQAFAEMSACLHERNERYLDFLKNSGDPADMRSKVLAHIVDSVADGLIVFDEQLTIRMANLAAAKLAFWRLEEMTRQEFRHKYKLFREDGETPVLPEEEPIVVAFREKKPQKLSGYVTSQDNEMIGRWVTAHAAPLLNDQNNVVGGVTVFTDETERVLLRRQRDCLAALIVHDIKNHLAAEQMLLDSLDVASLAPDVRKMITDLHTGSRKFQGIAISLLEVFRTNFFADARASHEVEVPVLLTTAVEMSAIEATNHQVEIAVKVADNCPKIHGLPAVYCHVFHNLIQNAVEASPPNSTVAVSVSADKDCVIVQVADTGAGMPADQVAQIFNPSNVAGKVPGTLGSSGFGLYLSYMLVEAQGGKVSCTSTVGSGTTMTVRLPI